MNEAGAVKSYVPTSFPFIFTRAFDAAVSASNLTIVQRFFVTYFTMLPSGATKLPSSVLRENTSFPAEVRATFAPLTSSGKKI